ncbi:MAG: 6-carboxyhexanoate--CoA ligase [Corynebacterium sp.]|uniref:6-carboxyhexanoate--CoA ligase n=1 Tax=Corynebacterium sp. TaxID=1720 RepID=UPI0026DCB27B|nr:6-carboxyhexanoate--CoA ligase [Corynebacterium sp.]MDO4761261.1 6-carboxyhexanoate--CoA ligase [Corynebacterium sp.]
MVWYSVRMRSSQSTQHISGAETLIHTTDESHQEPTIAKLNATVSSYLQRALTHPKGQADTITITVEQCAEDELLHLPMLPSIECAAGTDVVTLLRHHLPPQFRALAEPAESLLRTIAHMRGAALLGADGHRVEESINLDPTRGVRVSRFGHNGNNASFKDAHYEARRLATKVLAAPHVLAELCISDDPNYHTGYVAINGTYFRIPELKQASLGGRVILLDTTNPALILDTVHFLQHTPTLILDPEH